MDKEDTHWKLGFCPYVKGNKGSAAEGVNVIERIDEGATFYRKHFFGKGKTFSLLDFDMAHMAMARRSVGGFGLLPSLVQEKMHLNNAMGIPEAEGKYKDCQMAARTRNHPTCGILFRLFLIFYDACVGNIRSFCSH